MGAFSSETRTMSAATPKLTRAAFPHLPGKLPSAAPIEQTLHYALSDHRVRIEALIAETDTVWARINFEGRHTKPLYGIAPAGTNLGVPIVLIARFSGDVWTKRWYLGDELGLLLQLGQPNLLLA